MLAAVHHRPSGLLTDTLTSHTRPRSTLQLRTLALSRTITHLRLHRLDLSALRTLYLHISGHDFSYLVTRVFPSASALTSMELVGGCLFSWQPVSVVPAMLPLLTYLTTTNIRISDIQRGLVLPALRLLVFTDHPLTRPAPPDQTLSVISSLVRLEVIYTPVPPAAEWDAHSDDSHGDDSDDSSDDDYPAVSLAEIQDLLTNNAGLTHLRLSGWRSGWPLLYELVPMTGPPTTTSPRVIMIDGCWPPPSLASVAPNVVSPDAVIRRLLQSLPACVIQVDDAVEVINQDALRTQFQQRISFRGTEARRSWRTGQVDPDFTLIAAWRDKVFSDREISQIMTTYDPTTYSHNYDHPSTPQYSSASEDNSY